MSPAQALAHQLRTARARPGFEQARRGTRTNTMKPHRAIRFLAFALLLLLIPAALSSPSSAQVFVSVRFGPPALPIYAQPICPGPGYFWTPGYWAWNDEGGYYWVPGTWVVAPIGMLWTPGYWGWGAGFYSCHPVYWGPHVGFYGCINYRYAYDVSPLIRLRFPRASL